MDNGGNVSSVYRILIVDDNKPVRRSLELLLNTTEFPFTYKIYVSDNGKKAFALIEQEKMRNNNIINLVFTDYEMPNANGYQLMRTIREFDKNIKVILISGFPREDIRGEFDGCIEKIGREFYQLMIDEVKKQATDYFAEKVESAT
jgi:CheY-like chemotaxis protein